MIKIITEKSNEKKEIVFGLFSHKKGTKDKAFLFAIPESKTKEETLEIFIQQINDILARETFKEFLDREK